MEDEDSYVTIGTAFDIPEEDEAPKKRFDKHGQVAVDSKGRRRFHGAFTGGFSAGYFNTVGTKEGWTPSTFRSSRSSRVSNEANTQKPEDFMDDEDFSEYGIAPRMFMTKESFTPADKEVAERKRAINQTVNEGALRSAVPGGVPIDDLIVASKVSIGVRLLRSMGWKEGQGVGAKHEIITEAKPSTTPSKKVYGCSLQSNTQDENDVNINNLQHFLAPKDLQPIDFRLKDNTHGIGYSGIDPNSAMFIGSGSVSGIFKPTGSEKRGIRGQAFGIGAFEEEDYDIYNMEDMSEYDFAAVSERDSSKNYGWSGPPKRDKNKGAIAGFNRTSIPTAINKIFRPPLLPSNFIPKHEFNGSFKKAVGPAGISLSSSDRALLLGETKSKKSVKSVFDIVPEKDKRKIENVKSNLANLKKAESTSKNFTSSIPGTSLPFQKKTSRWDNEIKTKTDCGQNISSQSSTVFKPFLNDPEKQKRYDLFLSAKKFGKDLEFRYDRSVTEWEKEREIEEFTRASILYRPLSTAISSRFTRGSLIEDSKTSGKKEESVTDEKSDSEKAAKLGLFGKLTREIHDWYPSSLICKRFNVPDPYPHSQFTGTVGRGRKTGSGYLPYLESAVQNEQSTLKDDCSGTSHGNSNKSVRKDAKSESDGEEEHERGTENPAEHNLASKLNSSWNTLATSGPLSYLNNVDEERKEESLESRKKSGVDELGDDNSRPPMDLFRAIFADSSDTSGSESDDEKEKVANDDIKKELVGLEDPTPSIIHASVIEMKPTLDSVEEKNSNETDKEIIAVHQPPTVTNVIMISTDKGTGRCAAKEVNRSNGSLSDARVIARDEKDGDSRNPESNIDEKGDRMKERKRKENREVKKKKERKKKKKRKKEKRKSKAKKSRGYEKESSSEWSSYSEEDKVESKTYDSTSYGNTLYISTSYGNTLSSSRDRKAEKLRKDKRKDFVVKDKSLILPETDRIFSANDVKERNNKLDKYNKQYRKSRETAKSGRDNDFSYERCRSGDRQMAKRRSESLEMSKQPVVNSSKNEESPEGVPSAAELYQRLKKHGLTLKRMSAADFM